MFAAVMATSGEATAAVSALEVDAEEEGPQKIGECATTNSACSLAKRKTISPANRYSTTLKSKSNFISPNVLLLKIRQISTSSFIQMCKSEMWNVHFVVSINCLNLNRLEEFL